MRRRILILILMTTNRRVAAEDYDREETLKWSLDIKHYH